VNTLPVVGHAPSAEMSLAHGRWRIVVSSHLPSLEAAEIVLVQRIVRIMFLGAVGIFGHLLERQGFDGVTGGGED
jgi:hypothetical protein